MKKNNRYIWIAGIVFLLIFVSALIANTSLQKGAFIQWRPQETTQQYRSFPKIAKPDLVVSQIKRTIQQTTHATFMVTVKNQGSLAADRFIVSLIGSKDPNPIGKLFHKPPKSIRQDEIVFGLAPNQEAILTFTIGTSDPPLRSAVALADMGNVINESDEKNNLALFVFP